MLTEKDVQHIADLARIALTPDERERFRSELSAVLDYVAALEEVPTDAVEPLAQASGLTNALRADEHRDTFPMTEQLNELLVGQAPHKEDRYIKVKSVKKQS